MISKIKSNYLYNLALTVVNLLFPILSFPYASRIIGPLGIGKVQFTISFAQYFALIAGLGIPLYGIRALGKIKSNKAEISRTFMELIVIFFIGSLIMGAIYIITVYNIASLKIDLKFHMYASLLVFFSFSSIDWFYAGIEEFKIIAIRSTIVKLIALICLYVFVHTKEDLFFYFLISVSSYLLNNIINIFSVWGKVGFVVQDLNIRKHIRPLLFIFGTVLATSMYVLFDVVLLGFLSNQEAVGYYTSGMKLIRVAIPFVTSLGAVLIPKITVSLQENNLDDFNKIISKSFSFLMFFAVPIGIVFVLLSREFMMVFSGPQFTDSILSMQILSFLPLLIGIGHLLSIQILIPAQMDRELLISVVFGMLTSFIINFLLVPKFKQEGASIASVIAEVVVNCSYYYYISKKITVLLPFQSFINSLLSASAFIPIVYLSKIVFINNYILILLSSLFLGSLFYILIQLFAFKNEIVIEIKKMILDKINILFHGKLE